MSTKPWVYVVTDVETDGPWPGPNSMRSFASVATTSEGEVLEEFEAVLEPLPGAHGDARTMQWWREQPEWVWESVTEFPLPPAQVMDGWVRWVSRLPGPRAFAAGPLSVSGLWMDYYLRRFTAYGLQAGPFETDKLFDGQALCLTSMLAGLTGVDVNELGSELPTEWLGEREHPNHALADARGYANLLKFVTGNAGPARLELPVSESADQPA